MRAASARPTRPRLAVLGAGPVGLDAALSGMERGYDVVVYEAAPRPSANVRDWGHVRLFTPWAMNVSPRMRRQLERLELGWEVDEETSPTGRELANRVLDPLWASDSLDPRLRLDSRVVAIGREGVLKHEEIASPERAAKPFRLLIRSGSGAERMERADVVIDCTGKYGHPNTLGDGGIPALGELALGRRIERGIPELKSDFGEWRGRTVLLAGAGHSAQTVAFELAQLAEGRSDTKVLWVLRKERPDWGAVEDDPLSQRKRLTDAAEALARGASPAVEPLPGAVVEELSSENGGIRVALRREGAGRDHVKVDRVVSLTGGVGDHTIYRQLQVHECYATSGPMKLAAALLGEASGDCLQQGGHGADTLENPEPNYFILGDKSYGRNNTFLLRVGWEQVDEVFDRLQEGR